MTITTLFIATVLSCTIVASHAMEKAPQTTDGFIAKVLEQAQNLANNKMNATQDEWNLIYGMLNPLLDPTTLSDQEQSEKVITAIKCIDELWKQSSAGQNAHQA